MTRGRQRTIVVTTAAGPERRDALAALGTGATEVTAVPPTSLDGTSGLVVDGPDALAAFDPDTLGRWVTGGGHLLLIGAPPTDQSWRTLTGVSPTRELPHAEYVLQPDGHPMTTRVDVEIPVIDALRPVDAGDDARPVLQALIGARAVDVVTRRSVGDGSVTVAGFSGSDGVLRARPLATVLARALRPPQPGAAVTLGVGIIGYGAFAYRHGRASDATPGLRLTAVADADPRRRTDAAATFPGATIHDDTAALLADDAVDLVVIATPPVSHADLAALAVRAGRHVVVEKPLCLTVAEADRLLVLAAEHRRMLTVHQNRRWDPDFVAVRRVVEEGLLGDVFNVETFVGGFEHPCRAWHSEVSVSGGAVYDWGAHHLDWILMLLGGFPASVQTTRHKRVWHDVTNADQLRVRLRWDDGREAEFVDSTLAAVRRPKFYVQGTRGTLVGHYRPLRTEVVDPRDGYLATDHHHAEAPADLLLARYEAGLGVSETRLALSTPPAHAFHRNLADHLLLDEPLAVTAEQARRLVVLLDAAHRSGQGGGDELRVSA